MKTIKIVIIILVILLVITIIIYNKITKKTNEGFLSQELVNRFLKYQETMNKNNNYFNMDILKDQVSSEEVENYLKTGYWKWRNETINDYLTKIGTNKMIKIDPGVSLNYAMRLYNQKAINDLLKWNTKEGELLLYGVDLGPSSTKYSYHSASVPHNIIRCSSDDNPQMEKITYEGLREKKEYLKTSELTNEIPGFEFINGECNPCVAINGENSCAFKIKTKNDKSGIISRIWSQLWSPEISGK